MHKPALWEKSNGITRYFAEELSEEYEDEFGKMSGRCIDIGSGPCDVTVDYVLPKLNPNATIVCSDISDAMINFAKEKYKGNKRVSFLKLDIETPNLPKDLIGQFDHATSYYCLHWRRDMRQIFENFFKLLRPGGTILLAFITRFPGMNCFKDLAAMPRYQPYIKDMDHSTPTFPCSVEPRKTLKALSEDVGFEVHHCSNRDMNYTFDDLDVLADNLTSINDFVDRMPADIEKEYRKDLVRAVARHSVILKKNNDDEHDYSILTTLRVSIAYLKKPLIK